MPSSGSGTSGLSARLLQRSSAPSETSVSGSRADTSAADSGAGAIRACCTSGAGLLASATCSIRGGAALVAPLLRSISPRLLRVVRTDREPAHANER